MDRNNSFIECAGFYFIHNFDSGNLGHVEQVQTDIIVNVKTPETPDYEFNLWTRPDCAGTEFENGNRTWFYFGIQAAEPNVLVRLNLINLNKQGKMYNQGMAPVTRTLPGKPQWERIRDKPVHSTDDNTFTLSFKYRTAENPKATTFFAFTYPYSYAELQIALNIIDEKMLPLPSQPTPDDIYYCRENLIYSLEGRRVDLLTISSHQGMTTERETRLKNLFPDKQDRPFRFQNKKVIFVSARVHPGETPSSFVFNGFLNLLLTKNDPIAIQLRKLYVFKMVPFLNPDGVARGHYRTDTRGVNLNRVYLNPSLTFHPSVYAARALIRYHHFGIEKEDEIIEDSFTSRSLTSINHEYIDTKKKKNVGTKNDDCNKIFTKTASKVSGTPKSLSFNKDSKSVGESTTLEEQVYDLKLQEMSAQTSDSYNAKPEETSLLDESVLRTCLGANVHLSTSEDLNFVGNNPLKPIRETLKNSISLLMESNTHESKTEGGSNVRMGWCRDCQSEIPVRSETPVYHTIEEYREHQRQQISEQEGKVHDAERPPHGDNVYFCTNCFRRYIVTQPNEQIEKPSKPTSAKDEPSSGSAGDSVNNAPEPKNENAKPSKPAKKKPPAPVCTPRSRAVNKETEEESGLFLYIDLHGHASKKGIFMYGNHFSDADRCVECMLLPRMMSLNSLHFHFSSCNFTERNMYLKDRRDGMSREGSGRVAVLKATGLVRSYTLECNYNTGRLVNALPPPVRDAPPLAAAPDPAAAPPVPPKYTPHIFEEVGRSLGASILDVTGHHPNSRVPCSEHRSLAAVREWLRAHARPRPPLTMSRLRPKATSPTRPPLFTRSKAKVTDERKENAYAGAKSDSERRRSPPVLAQRSGQDVNNMKFAKKNEPVKTSSRVRYLAETEPKPKTLCTKRKNILAIRKPNPTKSQIGIVKTKASRRSIDDDGPRTSAIPSKLSKRSYARSVRAMTRSASGRARPVASSSSSEVGGWEEVAGGTVLGTSHPDAAPAPRRRPYPTQSPSRLKKIRLKNVL